MKRYMNWILVGLLVLVFWFKWLIGNYFSENALIPAYFFLW